MRQVLPATAMILQIHDSRHMHHSLDGTKSLAEVRDGTFDPLHHPDDSRPCVPRYAAPDEYNENAYDPRGIRREAARGKSKLGPTRRRAATKAGKIIGVTGSLVGHPA